jgi:hypothetical protein
MPESTEAAPPTTASEGATRFRGQQKRLFARWRAYLRREAGGTGALSAQTLTNTLPAWLDRLFEGFGTKNPRRDELRKLAQEHGEHRAHLREYTVKDLLTEYILLRRLLFETLEVEGPLSADEREYILRIFEEDSIEAVSGFMRVHSARSQGLLVKADQPGRPGPSSRRWRRGHRSATRSSSPHWTSSFKSGCFPSRGV